MREEDDSNWFSKWEEQLPSPEELMPLSQSLITPHLALAFNIPNSHHHAPPHPPQSAALSSPQPNSSGPSRVGFGSGPGSDEPVRTLKRPRLVWTPQLHKRFVDAVAHLGIKNAVPKTIMQLMSVDGLTRENVASHLQKYRLYLKQQQGGSSNGVGGANSSATDHLFASSPVPAHFLHPGRSNSEHYMPFVTGAPNQFRHFGSSPENGRFDYSLMRQSQSMVKRIGAPVHNSNDSVVPSSYVEDFKSAKDNNGRKALTLFPTGDN